MFQRISFRLLLTALLWCSVAPKLGAQDLRSSLFTEADRVMEDAQSVRADVLAPENYGKAMKHYLEATSKLDRGKSLDDIRKELTEAVRYFQLATEAAKLAEVTLAAGIQARSDAQKAEAGANATEIWQKAERKFAEAARKLEDGDVNGARNRSAEATEMYRDAELDAIKGGLLNATRTLIDQAHRTKVDEYAPKTLESAQNSLRGAEKKLTEDRYDTDMARGLARQAHYEARHALHLAQQIKPVDDKKRSVEDLVLEWEEPLRQIAAGFELAAEFDEGWEPATRAILAQVDEMQRNLLKLDEELKDSKERILDLEMQVSGLESSLGGATEEQMALKLRIEEQTLIREKFHRVENMFGPEEAHVFREGDDVYIRLTGLTFDVGRSMIKPDHFALLTQVHQAIDLFPYSGVTVEGHTDSYGGDKLNMKLSEERASAVRQYLIANMNLSPEDVDALGYGESRPIANNETPEGRTRNRRIDIVIHTRISR